MTTRMGFGTCAAITLALVVGLRAQSPDTSRAPSADYITVTGCIERAPTTRRTRTSEPTFILDAQTSKYRLDADSAKLVTHVGHKVEITGTVEQPARTTPADPKQGLPPVRIPGTLKVDAVRMMASTCR